MTRKPANALTIKEKRQVSALVSHFIENRQKVHLFLDQILGTLKNDRLSGLVHSVRHRVKDPSHLEDKLCRKFRKAKTEDTVFDIDKDNLFIKINDLAGARILHLHTSQISEIDAVLKDIVAEQKLTLVEGPIARTWDDEYREYFRTVGIETRRSENMYTSVHYVIASNSRTVVTCEIQVRTLMEEVWGEVDHTLNYPYPIDSVACREQIRALARATSSATRLVDSIFATVDDMSDSKRKAG